MNDDNDPIAIGPSSLARWYAKWERTQNEAAREQGYANMDHALAATDYKRRRHGR